MTELKEVRSIVTSLAVLAIGVIIYSTWSGGNLQAAEGNFTLSRPTIEIIGQPVVESVALRSNGKTFTYQITVRADLRLSHAVSDGFTAIPLLTTKGVDSKSKSFTFDRDSDTYTFKDTFIVNSDVPPVQKIDGNSKINEIIEGQEFWYETQDMGVYKFGMLKASKGIPVQRLEEFTPEFITPCFSTYFIECKTMIKTTELKQCETDQPDKYCRESFNLCGASVTITQYGDVDCSENTAKDVELQTLGGDVPWDDSGERSVLSFFESTVCTDFVDTLEDLKNCAFSSDTALAIRSMTFKISDVS